MKVAIIGCTYFGRELNKKGIATPSPYINNAFYRRIVLLLCRFGLPFYSLLYKKKWIEDYVDYDVIILFDSILNSDKVAKQIKDRVNISSRLIYFYWNTIDKNNCTHLKLDIRWECWTFDAMDAKRYNLKFANTFYLSSLVQLIDNESIDVFFVGLDKNRGNVIDEISMMLACTELRTCIKCVKKNCFGQYKKIPYNEICEYVAKSKALLDIPKIGQEGLTLRVMEALFNRKKIITNNENIKKYPFYSPKNIFILNNVLDKIAICDFLATPSVTIPAKLIEHYNFEQWLNRLINSVEAPL